MRSQSLDEIRERTRSLINAARENMFLARDLCEASYEILNDNSDLREFLFENRQAVRSKYQRWLDARAGSVPSRLKRIS
jgi:hypothetical protein